MPIQIICKSHKDQIKTKKLCSGQGQIMCFSALKGNNSKMNGPISSEFELVRDFMAFFVTCKVEDDSIKSQVQLFLHYKSIGKIFVAQGRVTLVISLIWPKIELIQILMAVFITCKFDEVLIEDASLWTTLSPL